MPLSFSILSPFSSSFISVLFILLTSSFLPHYYSTFLNLPLPKHISSLPFIYFLPPHFYLLLFIIKHLFPFIFNSFFLPPFFLVFLISNFIILYLLCIWAPSSLTTSTLILPLLPPLSFFFFFITNCVTLPSLCPVPPSLTRTHPSKSFPSRPSLSSPSPSSRPPPPLPLPMPWGTTSKTNKQSKWAHLSWPWFSLPGKCYKRKRRRKEREREKKLNESQRAFSNFLKWT